MMTGLMFHPDFNKFRTDYKAGEYDLAIAEITPKSDTPENAEIKFDSKAYGSYAVIAGMEAGTAALTAGKLEDSTKYLDMADGDMEGSFSFSSYKPKFYDKIMVNTYKGIAFWAQGDTDHANTEFNRLYERQKEAIEEHKREIEKNEEKLSSQESQEQLHAVQDVLNKEYTEYKNFKPYADFTNPFSTYISALYHVTAGYDKSEVENAVNYMRRVKTMSSNQYLASDIKMAEDRANGKKIGSNVWVIYEEGMAPEIHKKEIRIPFPTKSGIKMAKLVLPEFVSLPHSYQFVTASTSNGSYKTQVLADMERVIKTEYQRRYPVVVTSAVLFMIANLAIQEGSSQLINKTIGKKLDKKMSKHGGLVGKLGKNKLGSRALSSATSVAIGELLTYPLDTTTWSTLPKEIQMAKFKMPANRKIKITAAGGQVIADVKIEKKIKNAIIYVRSPAANGHTNWFVIDANKAKQGN
ncbi:MAG: hypothetical protein IKR92_03800 [Alphaproteobacteria bacterium]|nr:hypothetical protein [Alphaproteobacteria bacterium]